MEAAHKANPKDNKLYTELQKAKFKVKNLMNKKTEFDLYRLKSKYFEYGDKARKWLAYRLQKARASCLIPTIKSEKGEVLKTPLDINKRFKEYYESPYSSEIKPSSDDLDRFLVV